jgi:YHS domain-containing protein
MHAGLVARPVPLEDMTMSYRCARVMRAAVVALGLVLIPSSHALAQRVNASWNGLAVKGYDLVAYFTDGVPVRGTSAFEHVHQGVTYRFASAAHRDQFIGDPLKYLPQYGGYCAFAVSRNYTADIDPTAWRIVGGKLYLNYNAGAQARWAEDVPGNINKGDANWPALSRK